MESPEVRMTPALLEKSVDGGVGVGVGDGLGMSSPKSAGCRFDERAVARRS
jgi:hypothetical protein